MVPLIAFEIGGGAARQLIVPRCPICRGDNSPMFVIRLEAGSAIWPNERAARGERTDTGSVHPLPVLLGPSEPILRHSARVLCSVKCCSSLRGVLLTLCSRILPPVSVFSPAFLFSCVFQKMFLLLPVVILLLRGETVVSANSNDKWLSTVAQYNKDRPWNRFRDVSYTERHDVYPGGAL